MKRLLIVGTGGTISSTDSGEGLEASLSISEIVDYSRDCLRDLEFEVYFSDLMNIDSTLIQPEDWGRMAEEVGRNYDAYDGFVISHGTDTLAYTASMLAFMLRSPSKPVVLTGSMKPVQAPESDAVANISDAIHFAAAGCAGVFVAFNGKIIRAGRVSKVASSDVDAFASVNEPPLANMTREGIRFNDRFTASSEPFFVDTRINPGVFVLKIVPGMNPGLVDLLVEQGISGLVIESFGAGGLPYRGRDLLAAVGRAAERIPVVLSSQVLYDGVNLRTYEVGQRALEAGVISARDMTTEAAVTKLMWVLGHTSDLQEVRRFFDMSLAGEVTV